MSAPSRAAVPQTTTSTRASLTVPQGAALSLGAVLGTGVITLPAVAARIAGPASLLAWVALILLSVPLAGTFAALGARFPGAGGVASYVSRAFGERAGGAVGTCFFVAVPVGAPVAAMMAAGYVADVVGGGRATSLVVCAVLILVTAGLNAGGLRLSGRAQLAMASALALVMVVTVAMAAPHARVAHLEPFAPHGWSAIGGAMAVLVWGFAGWEAVASLSGEYRDPRRDLPRATAIAVMVVGVLYLALAVTALLVLGAGTGTSEAPLSDLLALALGDAARSVMAVVAVLLTLGAMNAYFAGASRLGAALAEDGALPGWLAGGRESARRPLRSLAVVTGGSLLSLGVVAVLDLDLATALLLTTGCFTLVYVLGTAAACRLLVRGSRAWALAVVACASTLALAGLTGWHMAWAVGLVGLSLAYQLRRSSRAVTSPWGAGRHRRGPRATSPSPGHGRRPRCP